MVRILAAEVYLPPIRDKYILDYLAQTFRDTDVLIVSVRSNFLYKFVHSFPWNETTYIIACSNHPWLDPDFGHQEGVVTYTS